MSMNILLLGAVCLAIVIFLKQESEYNYEKKDSVTNYLPWGFLLDNSVIYNKNGSFQKTYKFRGKDLNSQENIDLIYLRGRLNNALKKLNENNGTWSIHIESRRKEAKPYQKKVFKEKILQKIEDIRAEKYNSGTYFENEFYITFCWLPPADIVTGLKDKLIETKVYEENKKARISEFLTYLKEYVALLQTSFKEFEALNDEETLTYLHSCFSQNDEQKVVPARKEVFLDAYLSDTPIVNTFPPKLESGEYLGVVGILSFPNEVFPAMFEKINQLGFELRWTSRFIFYSSIDGKTKVERKTGKWAGKRTKTLDSILIGLHLKNPLTAELDKEAVEKAEEGEELLNDLKNDVTAIGEYTFSVIVKDKTIQGLDKKIEDIMSIVQNKGFTAIKESVNILEAFMGSMPGNTIHNVRNFPIPIIIATDLMQFVSVWSGHKENKHFNDVPLIYSNSTDGTDVKYFNLHVRDVGHTGIFGETGSGKSVLLNFLAAQFKKYENSQVFYFDKGGSSKVLTTAINGKFNDLGGAEVTFQPLANIGIDEKKYMAEIEKIKANSKLTEEEQEKIIQKIKNKMEEKAAMERDHAFTWICDIYEQENVILTPELKDTIFNALKSLAEMDKDMRSMTQFSIQLQDNTLRTAIKQYTNDGAYGRYFDSKTDSFTTDYTWQVFEMEKLMENKRVVIPMITYIFHRLEVDMFSQGKPTLLILDEFSKILENEIFARKVKDWMVYLRKKNVSVVFATQQLTDVLNSNIRDALITSCQTIIYLPNVRAASGVNYKYYSSLGLNDKQINIITNLEAKRDYYAVSKEGNLDFRPNFSKFEIAFIGASTPEEQMEAIRIKEELIKLEVTEEDWEKEFYKRWKIYKNLEEEI